MPSPGYDVWLIDDSATVVTILIVTILQVDQVRLKNDSSTIIFSYGIPIFRFENKEIIILTPGLDDH